MKKTITTEMRKIIESMSFRLLDNILWFDLKEIKFEERNEKNEHLDNMQ